MLPGHSGSISIPDSQHVIITESEFLIELNVEIIVGAYASVTYLLQNNNQPISSRVITFRLTGSYAQVTCSGAMVLQGAQQYNLSISQLHEADHTASSVDLKMVVDGTAQCTYNGMITITESGTKSVASQSHKALVISSTGTVTSEPKLEVLTHDVVCNHGSAIAYVNPEHMHYLMSRGISELCARKLIVTGFLV
jgi:Fe-S cluster assembly protein SufD